jgi:hypothetical protein
VIASEPLTERLRALWRRPLSFTTLVPVGTTSPAEVGARIAGLALLLKSGLASIGGLHTFRLVGAPPENPGGPARVLLNFVHDGPLDATLSGLVAAVGEPLAAAFAGADFSGRPIDLPPLLVGLRVPDRTFHLGAINRTVRETLDDARLAEALEAFSDVQLAAGKWGPGTPARTIRNELRDHVLAMPVEAGLPRGPAPGLTWAGRLLRFLDLLVTFAFPAIGVLAVHIQKAIARIKRPALRRLAWVAYGLWWIYGAFFTGLAFLGSRFLEIVEPDVVAAQPDAAKVGRIEAVEDLTITNEVTYWFPVKPTWVRQRVMLPIILWGSERGCRHFWTNGALAEIDTIHYARILQIDDGRTMLFMSDYDGSLDRYMIDFLGVGSSAVIPISSNVYGCPKTRWLFNPDDLSTFGPRLTSLLRLDQLETQVWYSAYPNLGVREILANAAVRDGLFAGDMSEAEASSWLASL